ncbi:hypothetical protein DY000_02021731 [Brassica cretica]|uniref:Retrotransposon gag domain-containing protein n=1 Tax=Brassica cretica TaxID=69181 RepID=A0ABQ7EJ62_BRACR|nr:hypothetical protein DY000_02021731 [Brassica cretica]
MDEWFSYHGVPHNERLRQAIKQLSRKAFSWWKRVDSAQGKSPEVVVTNWEDLKWIMIRKYVTTLSTPETRRKYLRRFSNGVSKKAKRMVPQQGHRSLIHHDQIWPNKKPTVLYDQYQPYEVPKAMEKKNFLSQDKDKPIFQEKAKDVKTGPEVQEDMISTSLLRSKVVHDLSPRDKEILNPKKEEPSSQCVVTGIKEQEFKGEEPPGATLVMNQEKVQDTKLSILLKEAKPVIKVSHQGSKNKSYMLSEVPRKEKDHKFSHESPHKWKSKSEQWIVQVPKPMVAKKKGSKKSHWIIFLQRESTPRETRNVATKTLKDHPLQKIFNGRNHSRGVILSHLLKEEPPDSPCITKPKLYQGKVLNSQKRMKPDLLYLGAGYPVSRSKLFQGGGYDAAIKSSAEPEVNPKPYSTSQGANQDIHALKMPYLTKKKGSNHEDNFMESTLKRKSRKIGIGPKYSRSKKL